MIFIYFVNYNGLKKLNYSLKTATVDHQFPPLSPTIAVCMIASNMHLL